jgi:diguanylate cyclase (GGDEF)-like protein
MAVQLSASGAVPAPLPANETQRLAALHRYAVLDSGPEQAYDDLTMLASAVCRAPIALISLVDRDRQWFKSAVGLSASETARELAFCAHAILQPDQPFEVPDAQIDPRFAGNPLVTGDPRIRFYAGAPLISPAGLPLGTICVIDRVPRRLSDIERNALQSLARQVVAQLELRQALAGLALECLTDSLTGLWNRRAFDRRLREEWNRHSRSGHALALLMVDLDHFKRVNDDFGHAAGDEVLKLAARVTQQTVRVSDFVARFGGEEFAVILPAGEAAAALTVATKLRSALQAAHWPQRPVTASIGVASLAPDRHTDPHGLLARADHALYAAKHAGRDRVQAFDGWD